MLLQAQVTNCDVVLGRGTFIPTWELSLGNLAEEPDRAAGVPTGAMSFLMEGRGLAFLSAFLSRLWAKR